MKLVVSIINSDDSKQVQQHLTKAGFFVTRLPTKGGFLQASNVTFLTGVDDDKVDAVISIISQFSRQRTITVDSPFYTYGDASVPTQPMDIVVGGATVFVLDVEQFHKL